MRWGFDSCLSVASLKKEEDLLDVEQKMEKLETEQRLKTESYEELKQKVQEAKQAHMEHQKLINMLVADTDPLKVIFIIFRPVIKPQLTLSVSTGFLKQQQKQTERNQGSYRKDQC